MAGNRYDPQIRRRAQQIHEDMRGHVTGAEVARMLKSEGHGPVPDRTVCLWLKRPTPLTSAVECLERQAVRCAGPGMIEDLEASGRGLARLVASMSARLESQIAALKIETAEDAARFVDATCTATRCTVELARATESLRIPRFPEPTKPPIDRSADEARDDRPFDHLMRSNFAESPNGRR